MNKNKEIGCFGMKGYCFKCGKRIEGEEIKTIGINGLHPLVCENCSFEPFKEGEVIFDSKLGNQGFKDEKDR